MIIKRSLKFCVVLDALKNILGVCVPVMTLLDTKAALLLLLLLLLYNTGRCCEWGAGEEARRFVRVKEDALPGHTLLTLNVSHPHLLLLQPLTQETAGMFRVAQQQEEDGGRVGRLEVGAPLHSLMLGPSPVVKLTLTCGTNEVPLQVTVYVEDVNDHAPVFVAKNITVTVDELTPPGLTILPEIRVTDDDKPNTANSEIELELLTGDEDEYFTMVDRKRGTITLAKHLDYDAGPKKFFLGVVAKDMGKPTLSSTSTITVMVMDADDLPPVFSHTLYTATVTEIPGPNTGSNIRQEVKVSPSELSARDGDVGQNTSLQYTLVESPAAEYFTLNPNTARLYLTKHLDREKLMDNTLVLHVRAAQVDNPRRVGSTVLEVVVEDVNDNLPQFTHDVYSISIVENLPSGFSVVQVSALDPDEGINGAFNYHVVGGGGALAVNPHSGWLTVANHNLLDREESPVIKLEVCTNQIAPLIKPLTNDSITHKLPDGNSTEQGKVTLQEGLMVKDTDTAMEEIVVEGKHEVVTSASTETMASERRKQNVNTRDNVPLSRRVQPATGRQVPEPVSSLVPKHARHGRQSVLIVAEKKMEEFNEREVPNGAGSRDLKTEPSQRQTLQQRDNAREKPISNTEEKYKRKRSVSSQRSRITEPYESLLTSPAPASTSLPLTSPVVTSQDITGREDTQTTAQSLQQGATHHRKIASNRFPRDTNDKYQRNRSTNLTGEINMPSPETESLSCAKIELKLLDANDNNPVFIPTNLYQFSITEEAQEGDIIGSVLAKDMDEGGNGQVKYKIQTRGNTTRGALRNSIAVDKIKGVLTLVSKLSPGQVTIFVEASDTPANPSETRTTLAVVTIDVMATHSWEPRFEGAPFELWVGGDAPVGTSIGQIRVVDLAGPEMLFDMFHSYHEGVPFGIEETSGTVSVLSPLKKYSRPTYEFEVVVTDGRSSLATNLTIHVAPAPRSTTRWDTVVHFTIQENLSGGLVGNVVAALRNAGARVAPDPQFELVSPEARHFFTLSQDATLYTVAPLDYEAHPNHTLVVVSSRTSDIFYVHVKVEDVNDNAPQFNAVSYEGVIKENSASGTSVRIHPMIHVIDRDTYTGATYYLQLLGDSSPLFTIDSSSGDIIFVGQTLDREVKEAYNLVLVARDDGNLTSNASLTITVEDINDNPPRFTEREPLFSARGDIDESSSRKLPDTSKLAHLADLERSLIRIPESLPIGSRVTQLSATDEDEKVYADIRYSIVSEKSFGFSEGGKSPPVLLETNYFAIDTKTGVVTVAGIIEADHFYLVNVSATDGGGLSSYTTVSIAVYDVNDHSPRFERPVYNFEVVEGEYLVGEVGKVVAYDQDKGNNAEVSYKIIFYKNSSEEHTFPFRVVETSGTLLATGSVDREEREVYEFSVVATDMGEPQLSSSVLVHIDIIDINDHSPIFYGYKEVMYPEALSNTSLEPSNRNFTPVYIAVVSESTPRNTIITNVFANDSDSSSSGNGIILYKLEGGEDKFAIDSKNGSVYTVGNLDYERWPEHNLTVLAQDHGLPPLTASALIMVQVTDVKEELTTRLFDREEYRVHVTENNKTPLLLVDLNVSDWYAGHRLHFQLADPGMTGTIAVDSHSGEVYLIASLDRETKDMYRFKVRAIKPERGRALQHFYQQASGVDFLEYTVTSSTTNVSRAGDSLSFAAADGDSDRLTNTSRKSRVDSMPLLSVPAEVEPLPGFSRSRQRLKNHRRMTSTTFDSSRHTSKRSSINSPGVLMDGGGELGREEVWIIVVVEDQNDNSPRFLPHGRPIVAAVPAAAAYGHFVTRITAHDPDLGVNGEVRYEILPGEGAKDATTKFTVDPSSGQVVVVGSLENEAGKMFGFDVRATDQHGAPTGRTAIANVFVYVIGAGGHLVVEVGATPRDVEPHLHHIQGMLTNVSGLDVRVQRIAPHVDGDAAHTTATDVYVYAVDPVTQAIVEAAQLRQALRGRKGQLRSLLPSGLQFKGMRLPQPMKQGHILQTAELAILVGAVVVFLSTVTAIACLCYKQRKRRRKPMPLAPLMTANGVPVLPLAYPGHFAAPYTHMSDHSSADSSDAQEVSPDHLHYCHDPGHYPQEVAHYPHPSRPRWGAHNHHSDHEHYGSEHVPSHTDEDDTVPVCLRHVPSRKRRRGSQASSGLHGQVKRCSSRIGAPFLEEPSSSDLDERDHVPAQVIIPKPPRCCPDDRQHGRKNNSRALPAVDCTLDTTRPQSPDSLERPLQTHGHIRSQSQVHIHSIPRTHLKRERTDHYDRKSVSNAHSPSDVTEL
nr:cadherin-89D-like isoform X2 [Cherax quadricarinatus]